MVLIWWWANLFVRVIGLDGNRADGAVRVFVKLITFSIQLGFTSGPETAHLIFQMQNDLPAICSKLH